MFRIDDPSAAASLPVPEPTGTPGFWTEGNPATGIPATLERASWFNSIQEELMSVLAAGGITASKTTYTQLLAALQAMYGNGRIGHAFTANDWVPLAGGLIVQWGVAPAGSSSSGSTVSFPVAFPNSCLSVTVSDAGNQIYSYGADSFTKTTFKLYGGSSNSGAPVYATGAGRYIAIGF